MNDLDLLIETAKSLCANLDQMASNERKFGWQMSYELNVISRQMGKMTRELDAINNMMVGGVI